MGQKKKLSGPKLKDSVKEEIKQPPCQHTTLVKTQEGIYICAACRGILKYSTNVFVAP